MTQQRPVIGIIACNRPVEGEPAQIVKARYIEAVASHADAVPLICPSMARPSDAPAMVARLDAIMLTGSNSNIVPARYGSTAPGQPPHDLDRDEMAAALIDAALTAGKPVIGICRGLQEINVALGGTLADQRTSGGGQSPHHAPDGVALDQMFGHAHAVSVVPGSAVADYAGTDRLTVNSVHYQAIEKLGSGLVVAARADDGIVEAVASESGTPVLAVQWHPEWRPEERAHDLEFWRHVGLLARHAMA